MIEVTSEKEVCRDLFGDYSSRIILTTQEPDEIQRRAQLAGLKCFRLGTVGGSRLIMKYEGIPVIDVAVDELEEEWQQGLPRLL